MSNNNITKSQNLLKRLEEEMSFLSSLMSQVNSLSPQVVLISSSLKETWKAINQAHKDWKREVKNS